MPVVHCGAPPRDCAFYYRFCWAANNCTGAGGNSTGKMLRAAQIQKLLRQSSSLTAKNFAYKIHRASATAKKYITQKFSGDLGWR